MSRRSGSRAASRAMHGPLAVDAGRHVHEGPGPIVDDNATHFPVHAAPGGNPDQVDERVRFAGFHEPPAGRLEFYTLIVLLTPGYWRR